jgi:putative CRISPR-associated protein (TIGR02619 family)
MSRVILTTVGTSLKHNAEKAKKSAAECLRENPRDACAETNVLDRLLQSEDTVELFHSETLDGEGCAREIHAWVTAQGYTASLSPIAGLTYRTVDFHWGLRSLVRCLAGRLRTVQREGKQPVLNALGGFKSEVAYATLVGALFGIPNVYIHHGFDELLTIPPLPVGWDIAQIDTFSDILNWLDTSPRSETEAYSRLQSLPQNLRETLTEAGSDGCRYLSPLGEAYFEAYRSRIETAVIPVYLSSSAARNYARMEPSLREAFDHVLARLRVPEIRRNGSKTMEQENGDVCVFPQGHVDERVFWYAEGDTVHVLEMVRHGRKYERLYEKGVRRAAYSSESWQVWPISSESAIGFGGA